MPEVLPGRRSIVRAAAWTVPVVATSLTVPAYAASATGQLSFNSFTAFGGAYSGSQPTQLTSETTISSLWVAAGPTLTALTLTVSYPLARIQAVDPVGTPKTGQPPQNGWVFSSRRSTSAERIFVFTWTGSVPSSGSTGSLSYSVSLVPGKSGTLAVTSLATSPGFTQAGPLTTKVSVTS